MSVDEIVEALKGITLAEAEELVEKLTEAFPKLAEMPAGGVMMMAGGGGEGGGGGAVEEEPTEFNLVLTGVGEQKVQVIKAVRELTNLGLKEAKEAVEAAPYTVLEAVEKEAAEAGKEKLAAAGATAEVKPA
ncbi:MAG: 50S ribosomal protein L7/L12 [Armatimonadetes bacterium]|nr:50S ribosomal protein L7/L12 [Armatimonadota bacterium]